MCISGVCLFCLYYTTERQLHKHNARGIHIQLHAHQLHNNNCWAINCVIIPAPMVLCEYKSGKEELKDHPPICYFRELKTILNVSLGLQLQFLPLSQLSLYAVALFFLRLISIRICSFQFRGSYFIYAVVVLEHKFLLGTKINPFS